MSDRKLEDKLTGVIDGFAEKNEEDVLRYQRAIDKFDDMVKRGLVKKRESILIPIEEMHKPSPLLTRGISRSPRHY